ncbi:MAG: MG2 domain-containing protein [Ignavibacteriales bacterium]|nr:MG2 domain-containing protein [Ignavibacteriales bacterium]
MDDLGYGRWANWDYDDEGYDYGWGEWRNRDNPCSDAYFLPRYNREAVAGRNFFASDIGLVAKLEAGGTLRVVTTDIGTARPLSGLKVRAYNYQNRLLGETASDGNGFAALALEDRPFYVSAEGGGDIGYLRVSSEGVLALSHFDVGGEVTQKGVKGIVYGERGVWRPGDTLHLTFALFDRDEVLPDGHPVLMELTSPQGQLVGTFKPEKVVEPFYAFRAETDEAAPTGNWRARVLVGGLTFEKTLKIETVVPNRLKIALDAGRETLLRKDMPFEAAVAAQWLHGAPAANLKYDVSVRLSRAGDPVRPVPGLRVRRPGPRLRGRHGRGGQGRPRRRRQGPGPDRHQAAAAQPGPARRRLHQPGLRGERRLQRRHLLPALPSLRFLCRRPRAARATGSGACS